MASLSLCQRIFLPRIVRIRQSSRAPQMPNQRYECSSSLHSVSHYFSFQNPAAEVAPPFPTNISLSLITRSFAFVTLLFMEIQRKLSQLLDRLIQIQSSPGYYITNLLPQLCATPFCCSVSDCPTAEMVTTFANRSRDFINTCATNCYNERPPKVYKQTLLCINNIPKNK